MWYTGGMARTDKRKNVILVISRDKSAVAASAYKGNSVEVQTDGTIAVGSTPVTGATFDAVKLQLVQPCVPSTGNAEGSAQYCPEEIFDVLNVPEHQLT